MSANPGYLYAALIDGSMNIKTYLFALAQTIGADSGFLRMQRNVGWTLRFICYFSMHCDVRRSGELQAKKVSETFNAKNVLVMATSLVAKHDAENLIHSVF